MEFQCHIAVSYATMLELLPIDCPSTPNCFLEGNLKKGTLVEAAAMGEGRAAGEGDGRGDGAQKKFNHPSLR